MEVNQQASQVPVKAQLAEYTGIPTEDPYRLGRLSRTVLQGLQEFGVS